MPGLGAVAAFLVFHATVPSHMAWASTSEALSSHLSKKVISAFPIPISSFSSSSISDSGSIHVHGIWVGAMVVSGVVGGVMGSQLDFNGSRDRLGQGFGLSLCDIDAHHVEPNAMIEPVTESF